MSQFKLFKDKNIENSTESDPEWKSEWVDMPEFIQEKQEPFSKIIIRFETEEDLNDFSELISQKLTPKTKSIWFPYKSHFREVKKEWRNES